MGELLFHGLVFGTSLVFFYLLHRQSPEVWRAAAERCGLQIESASRLMPKITARSGQIEVRFGSSGDRERPTRIVVEVPGPPGFREVEIRTGPRQREEIEIGDAHFDGRFAIRGPVRLVSALLDEETRRLLTRASFLCPFHLVSGKIQVHVAGDKVFNSLRSLLEVSRRFAQPIDVPQRIADNATKDPQAGVRLHNLRLLIRELSRHPVAAETLRAACSDGNPEIRLQAARELGAEARGVLVELAGSLEVDAVSADALALVLPELPFERVQAILEQALRRRRLRSARLCLEAIGRGGAPAAVDMLAKVLALETGELAPAAAEALGATGRPAAEPPLIRALERSEAEVRVAAAAALGRVGSADAVLPLKEAAERFRPDPGLRQATRQAIAEIQSRLQGASPGQLSLAGAESGLLSLAEAETGQVSLAETEAGQVSLTEDPSGQLSLGGDDADPRSADS